MIRIGSYPPAGGVLYLRLFHEALEPFGIRWEKYLTVNDAELRADAGRLDVLHFHWSVEHIWAAPGRIARARRLAGFYRYLRLARRLGLKIVWTVHELHPHGGDGTWLDRVGFRLLARAADLCVCHDAATREDFIRMYGGRPERTVVVPHGNYDGGYPPPNPTAGTFARLGLDPRKRTLVCVGFVRPYKGFDLAVRAVRRLGPDYQLVITGKPGDAAVRDELRELGAGLPGFVFDPRSVENDEMADLLAIADAVLLPYRRVTGSGVLLSALTAGRGVVAADLRYFRDALDGEPDAGVFFPVGDEDGLVRAIETYFAGDVPARHAAARRLADRYAWPAVVGPVVDWYCRAFPEQARCPEPAPAGV